MKMIFIILFIWRITIVTNDEFIELSPYKYSKSTLQLLKFSMYFLHWKFLGCPSKISLVIPASGSCCGNSWFQLLNALNLNSRKIEMELAVLDVKELDGLRLCKQMVVDIIGG